MAQPKVAALSLEDRARLCGIVRRLCLDNASEWGRLELEETKLGRLDHKIDKRQNVRLTAGAEAMGSEAKTDAAGRGPIEHAPGGAAGRGWPARPAGPTMATNPSNRSERASTAGRRPLASISRMQSGIAPWPGNTTRSARRTTSESEVTVTSASGATCSSALETERKLPMP